MTHPDEHHFFQDRNMPVPNSPLTIRRAAFFASDSPAFRTYDIRTIVAIRRRAITACFPEHCGLTVCGCGLPTPTTSSLGSRSIFLAPRQYLDVHAVRYGERFLLSPAFMDPFTASVCMSCMLSPIISQKHGKRMPRHTYICTYRDAACADCVSHTYARRVGCRYSCMSHAPIPSAARRPTVDGMGARCNTYGQLNFWAFLGCPNHPIKVQDWRTT